jgi:type I restriction enzyme S subunit
MHVGRDCVLQIAFNHSGNNKIVSPAYTVFKIKENNILLNKFFFIYLKSSERDRYFWFNCDSSVRDGLSFEELSNIEIELPPLPIQQKYVDIYDAMLENQQSYEEGLEDLKLVCDAYIEQLFETAEKKPIGEFIKEVDVRNKNLKFTSKDVRGISTEKEFIPTKANMNGVSVSNYKVVAPSQFAYVEDTSRRGDKISLAFNGNPNPHLVSSITTVFEVFDKDVVPEYLSMFLKRSEFDRYARYNSWGSARETISWEDLGVLEIPIPDLEIQQSIVNIYRVYNERKKIAEEMKTLLKDMSPLLVKGAIEETEKE